MTAWLPWLASLELRGKVVLVAGPPLSGKSTLARAHLLRGDGVVDFDVIHAELTGLPLYHRDLEQLGATSDEFVRQATAITQGWIVRPGPEAAWRARVRTFHHARSIVLEVPPQVCHARLGPYSDRPRAEKPYIAAAIDRWWQQYQRDVDAQQRDVETVLPASRQWRAAPAGVAVPV